MHNDIELRKKIILALSETKGIGYYTIRKLYAKEKHLERLLDYSLEDLIILFLSAGIKYSDKCANNFYTNKADLIKRSERMYEDFHKRNIHFMLDDESMFPQSLKIIPETPYWLFIEGNPEALSLENIVAVVGTRNPTAKGIRITEILTRFLVLNKFVIVSGLAEGIDEAAHCVTNSLGGKGIAVLGCGIDLAFPARTYRIRKSITTNSGAVISEFMPKESYSKKTFYWRNRIQSGLSTAIFPIQGTFRSGTSHTINFAEQQQKILIGVFLENIEPIPQNEILKFLKTRKYPVLEVTSEQNEILKIIKKRDYYQRDFEQVPLFVSEGLAVSKFKEKDIQSRKRNIFQRILARLGLQKR